MKAKVYSVNLSRTKGVAKIPVSCARIIEDFGLESDVHAGDKIRQVSLLSIESIKGGKGGLSLKAGDFAENITTEGIDLSGLKIGDRLKLGQQVVIEISKIGKECHRYCSIYYKTGDCIMPREGIFAKVLKGGNVARGDDIEAVD